jgi:nucleoside-diphosphate-sugar epimerase
MKDVLITGAGGTLGEFTVRHLRADGYGVTGVRSSRVSGATGVEEDHSESISVNLLDDDAVETIVDFLARKEIKIHGNLEMLCW